MKPSDLKPTNALEKHCLLKSKSVGSNPTEPTRGYYYCTVVYCQFESDYPHHTGSELGGRVLRFCSCTQVCDSNIPKYLGRAVTGQIVPPLHKKKEKEMITLLLRRMKKPEEIADDTLALTLVADGALALFMLIAILTFTYNLLELLLTGGC